MGGPDTSDMGPLCAAIVKAYHACAPSLLSPFLAPNIVYSGLARQHTGVQDVLRALFGGGAKRTVKPSKELARVEEAGAATPVTCDMVILSQSPGGQWNEHLYLDRVTVCDGLVTAIVRRALRNVAGGGLSSLDGRERYQLVGRNLSAEEKAVRVLYCWDAERFMCPGFLHLLPDGGKDVPLELLKDNA